MLYGLDRNGAFQRRKRIDLKIKQRNMLMRPNHIIHVCPSGCVAATAEIYDQSLATRLKASQSLNDLAASNLTDLARLCHKAIAGRGCIQRCSLDSQGWSLIVGTVKSRSLWYAPGQDPYEVFNGRILGNHGSFEMLDVSASKGALVSITLDHDLPVSNDYKIVYRNPNDSVL
jgi:hypothetical protein